MGVLSDNNETVNVVLAKGKDYKPTIDGAIIYFNAGNDGSQCLTKLSGGKVMVPKPKSVLKWDTLLCS